MSSDEETKIDVEDEKKSAKKVKAKQIESKAEFVAFQRSDKPLVIDFYASWCGPCKTIAPILDKMVGLFPNINFVKVDVDEYDSISEEYNVKKLPTLVCKNGGDVLTYTGAGGIKDVLAFCEKYTKAT